MSALGHKRTSQDVRVMSALTPKADIGECDRHVRFVPQADIKPRAFPLVPATAPMPSDTSDGQKGYKHYSERCHRHDASV
jgi:hypothetical protein